MKAIISSIPSFILAVIIFIVALFLLWPVAKKAIELVGETLGFGPKLSLVEKAAACSYYRCVEGCVSDITRKYCGDWFKEACSDPELIGFTDNFKICDENAEQFPVELSTKEIYTISKENLEDILTCITTDDSSWLPAEAVRGKFLHIKKSLIKSSEREECVYVAPFNKILNSIRSATLFPSRLYIYTYQERPPIQGVSGLKLWEAKTTLIAEAPLYIKLTFQDKEKTKEVVEGQKYRINIELENYNSNFGIYISEIGEYDNKKYIIFKIFNKTFSDTRQIDNTMYPEYYLYLFSTFEEFFEERRAIRYELEVKHYLHIKVLNINNKAELELSYTSYKPEDYKEPPSITKSCEKACEEFAIENPDLDCKEEWKCDSSCETIEGWRNAKKGDSWCSKIIGMQYCCCRCTAELI